MTRSYPTWMDADFTPNDMGAPDSLYADPSRTPEEIGDSELETLEQYASLT